MLTLPDAIVALLVPFATLFTSPTWRKAQLLLIGAILTPGQRTVAAALRVMGRSDQRDYARYHEVLNRAVWSPRQAPCILLVLLLQHLDQGDRPVTTNSRDASTRSSPTGPARWSCNCAAGCPTDPWCWWATTAMPCWICSTAASPSVNPLP